MTTYLGPAANRAICAVIREVEAIIKGDNASRIEAIWQKVFRAFTYVGTRGATTAVVSGIDIAATGHTAPKTDPFTPSTRDKGAAYLAWHGQ